MWFIFKSIIHAFLAQWQAYGCPRVGWVTINYRGAIDDIKHNTQNKSRNVFIIPECTVCKWRAVQPFIKTFHRHRSNRQLSNHKLYGCNWRYQAQNKARTVFIIPGLYWTQNDVRCGEIFESWDEISIHSKISTAAPHVILRSVQTRNYKHSSRFVLCCCVWYRRLHPYN